MASDLTIMNMEGVYINNESVWNITESEVTNLTNAFEVIRSKETELFFDYKFVAYTFGTIIFLSNLTVVVSSGLIIKKGQQPKSTYLLLGNMSLADTIIGISIVFGHLVENTKSYNTRCIIQLGMLVCPTMVSIFTVGLIAVDRYIYILHGLYYQRWCNTTRVRISIAITWLIGLILGFLPATGWINKELMHSRCYYVSLYPGALILLNSLLSIVPLILVGILYSIILIRALKNMREIKSTNKSISYNSKTKSTIRVYRGNTKKSVPMNQTREHNDKTKRSASLDGDLVQNHKCIKDNKNGSRSQSFDDIKDEEINDSSIVTDGNTQSKFTSANNESNFSINTITSSVGEHNDVNKKCKSLKQVVLKIKEPSKWKAIIIVLLTSGSVIFTWMPFFITAIFYVFCQEKLTNPKCIHLRGLLTGPVATVAFVNSILNPLIYAWWHKGFKGIIQMHIKKCFNKFRSK